MSCLDFAKGKCFRSNCKFSHGPTIQTGTVPTNNYATGGGYGQQPQQMMYAGQPQPQPQQSPPMPMQPMTSVQPTTDASNPDAAAAFYANYAQQYQAAYATALANNAAAAAAGTSTQPPATTQSYNPAVMTVPPSQINYAQAQQPPQSQPIQTSYAPIPTLDQYQPQTNYGQQPNSYGGPNANLGYPPMAATTYSAPFNPNSGYGGGNYNHGYNSGGYSNGPMTSYGGGPGGGGNICRDFKIGRCNRGNMCRFSHDLGGPSQPNKTMSKSEVCGDYLKGRCSRGDMCRYSHDKTSGPPCRDYLKGLCTRGDACRYHHFDGTNRPVCKDFQRGRCDRINDCKYSHDLNEQTAAQLMLSGANTYQGEPNGMHSSSGFVSPGAYAGGQYGGGSVSAATGGSGQYGGYAASTNTAGGEGQTSWEGQSAPSQDDTRMPSGMSGRKRGREENETSPPSADGSHPQSFAPIPYGDSSTEEDDQHKDVPPPEQDHERPSKQLKTGHHASESDSSTPNQDTPTADHSSELIAAATRGADGKSLVPSSIEGIEGGPDVTDLASTGELTSVGGIIDAGQQSADQQPSSTDGGPALDRGGQPVATATGGVGTSGPSIGSGGDAGGADGGSNGGGGGPD